MSRRILSAFLALVLVAGFAAVTKADVGGSFDLHISMQPMGTQTESVKFFFDIQSNLDITVTLSGLSIGADLGFGTTGVEFAVISLNTSLGALAVDDTFVFAMPFGSTAHPNCGGGDTGCPGNTVFPMGDGDGDGAYDGAIGFVKKRIDLELNIAGITLNNLALFEDVDFPDINGSNNHEHDHFTSGVYCVSCNDSVVDNQTPTFGFGDVISISGQTVSGISVSGTTALCASGTNTIKKRHWSWEVNKACTAQFGQTTTAIEGGAKTPLLFELETLDISGVEIGGINFDASLTFKPLSPLSAVISASFDVLDLASVDATLTSNNITNLSFAGLSITVVTGNLIIILDDDNGDLTFDGTTAIFNTTLNPNQNPADLGIVLVTNSAGITFAQVSLGIQRGILALDTSSSFAGSGNLAWVGTDFSLSVDYGNGFAVTADLSFSPSGLSGVDLNLGLTF